MKDHRIIDAKIYGKTSYVVLVILVARDERLKMLYKLRRNNLSLNKSVGSNNTKISAHKNPK